MTVKILSVIAALLLAGYLVTRIFGPSQTATAAEEQAVIITIRLRSGDMGTAEERKRIVALENQLAAEIEKSGSGEYDGDELGEWTCTIYTYGPSAEKLFLVTPSSQLTLLRSALTNSLRANPCRINTYMSHPHLLILKPL